MEQKLVKNLCILFLHDILYKQKLSEHTVRAYKKDLGEFFNFDSKEEFCLEKLPTSSIKVQKKKQFELEIKNCIKETSCRWTKLSSASRGRKLAAMRSFIKWLAENKHIKEDFRHLFKSPKVAFKIPHFLSVDEVLFLVDLLDKKKEKKTKDILRDRALFFLLYGGGLRISEACSLKTQDIDWDNNIIKIKGKGNKERLVAMPKKSINALKELKLNSVYFFGDEPLANRKAYEIIKNLGSEANLLKDLHPHALRHSFATHLLSSGSDLRALQELLGHKTLSATQKYTHLDLTHLSQTLNKFHPIYQGDKF